MARSGRIAWIDAARALGACAIVLLHVLVSTSIAVDVGLVRSCAYAIVGIVLTRWAVPAFFMLTGYLMLDPARPVSVRTVGKHVWHMLFVLLTFGYVFAVIEEVWIGWHAVGSVGPRVLLGAARDVASMRSWDHLWYVYAMVVVYPLVPALRALGTRVGQRGFELFTLALFAVVQVVPTLLRLAGAMGLGAEVPDVALPAFVTNAATGVTCCCMGTCLRHRELNARVACAGLASLATMLVMSLAGIFAGVGDRGFVFLQGSCFASTYAATVLLALKHGLAGRSIPRIGSDLARDSLGIYLIHPLFVHLVLLWVDPLACPPVAYEAVFFAVALAASVVSTRLLRRIPLFANVL